MNYALITPIKNERDNIYKLGETVLNQTIKPSLWVIVDGNSNDGSYEVAKNLFEKYDWIEIIRQKQFLDSSHLNFAIALKEGYEYIKRISKKKKIEYNFIGKIDATIELPKNYFEKLIEELQKDPRLGIVSGTQYLKRGDNLIKYVSIHPMDLPDTRLYRVSCLEEIGGFPVTYSPDVVLVIKARMKGWKVKRLESVVFYENRLGGLKEGAWKGYKEKGIAMHYLGYNPILVALSALYDTIKFSPHYQGIPMMYGYLISVLQKKERINDSDVIKYFWKDRLNEIYCLIKQIIFKKLKLMRLNA